MASKILTRSIRFLPNRKNILDIARKQSLWTADNIVKSPYKELEIPKTLTPDYMWENIDKWADKTALVCGVTNRSFTYHQLMKYSKNFAVKLRTQFKIRDGDTVCIMMPNLPEYAIAVLGILQAGAAVTTANPIYTAHEVGKQLTLSNPKIAIGVPTTIPVIKDALKLAKKNIPVITVKNNNEGLPSETISFQELYEDNNVDYSVLNNVKVDSEDTAFLPYSSGTTGLPKGVELTHKNIVINCMQQDIEGVKQYYDTTSSFQDTTLAVLPFYHIYGLVIVLLHKLSVGGKVVTLPTFEPKSFLNSLQKEKVGLLYAAPPIVLFLGSYPEAKTEHISSLHKVICGAAPVPKADIENVFEKHNLDFIQVYGMTETSPLVTAVPTGSRKYTTAGVPISNTELKIVDSDLRALGPNEVGELFIRGPQVMKGYRNNPEANKAAITEDGWFRSGDLGKIDESGSLIIADRLKELIKVKGYQVPPAELEALLKEHSSILDAGVVGIPDPKTGEVPRAFIVLKDGHKVEAQEIKDFVSERVASYKRIQDIVFLDSLPKNPSGKLLRRVLKEMK